MLGGIFKCASYVPYKSPVSCVEQDMLNILLCKNQAACFRWHPQKCFPVFKCGFVAFCVMYTCTFWEEGVRMNPELQCNLNIVRNTKNKNNTKIQCSSQNSMLLCSEREKGLRNYSLSQIYSKLEAALTQKLIHCCSFSANRSESFHRQITQPLNLMCFCKTAIPVAHRCFQRGYSEHRVHN